LIIFDRLLVGGIRFALDKLAQAVETELNDDDALREQLLAAQMQLELGQITDEEFAALEDEILPRLREIQLRRRGAAAGPPSLGGDQRISGVEIDFGGDEDSRG